MAVYSSASPEAPTFTTWIQGRLNTFVDAMPAGTYEAALWSAGIVGTIGMFGVLISPAGGIISTFFALIVISLFGFFPVMTMLFLGIIGVIGIIIGTRLRQ